MERIAFLALAVWLLLLVGLQVLASRNAAGEQPDRLGNIWRAFAVGENQKREWYTARGWAYVTWGRVIAVIGLAAALAWRFLWP